MKSVKEAKISSGQKVLVRCDLDVPIKNRQVAEKFRLDAALDTLKYIISLGATPVIAGHMGKPEGKSDPQLSTKLLEPYFDEMLGKGQYSLLENLRFNKGEELNDPNFSETLARGNSVYVNESFATSHRKHASIVGITEWLPSYAGLRFEKEINTLNALFSEVKKPFVVVIGGAKLESKLPVVQRFLKIADYVLLGGKLGLEWNREDPYNLVLPKDYADENKDIGKETIKDFVGILHDAQTVLWAGPMGAYEEPGYSIGTALVAKEISDRTKAGAFTVIGGGDTVTAVNSFSLLENFSFVSTGGGAMLQYLADRTLPGIEALNKNRYA